MKSILTLSLCLAFALPACKPVGDTGNRAPDIAAQPPAATAPEAAPTAAPVVDGQAVHYQCGDLLISTRMQRDGMQLSFSGREITLPHVPSASGAKYGDGKVNEFSSKGQQGVLMLDGKNVGNCTRSDRASPWEDAKARNVGFRAVGNEPGWFVEVSQGEAPVLHAELDYGERELDIANAKPLVGIASGFVGIATDGTNVELRIKREACSDGMSGEAFEASAELVVGDKSYKGCGAYLFE
ncbi:MAG: MliC family protein [Lysobacter sp.]|nr:MliC family protein [Lysobacter sp.]